ncbi:MAG: RAD55 family ATPase [Candidatus Hydrothermarchaeota archaeon]
MREIRWGIKGFDKLMGKNFPKNCNLLLIGRLGSGKSIFCEQVIYEGLKQGIPGVYVTVDEPPYIVKENLARLGCNADEYKNLAIVDCYSYGIGRIRGESPLTKEPYVVKDPTQIDQIGKKVHEIRKEFGGGRLVLDSLSGLLSFVRINIESAIRLGHTLFETMMWSPAIIVSHEAMDLKIISNALRSVTHGVIRMRLEENEEGIMRSLRVENLMGTTSPWKRYHITEKGIIMEE